MPHRAAASAWARCWPLCRRRPRAKVAPITIVINQSPWFGGFSKAVEAYEKQTGNKVTLDVNPFAGSAEKQRNSVRSSQGQFDILVMNSTWLAEFYHGGFLTPLGDIDPAFKLDPQVLSYDDTAYWDAKTKTNSAKTGALYGVPLNGNIQLLFYRADLYQQHGLKVPETWDQLLANAQKLHNPPNVYGMVFRGAQRLRHLVRLDAVPAQPQRRDLPGREGRRLHRHHQQPRREEGARHLRGPHEKGGAAEPGQLRPGPGDPGAGDRQGRARDAGDRRVVADGRSDQVRSGRQDQRRSAAAWAGRQAVADAGAFHRLDTEEHPEGPAGRRVDLPQVVPDRARPADRRRRGRPTDPPRHARVRTLEEAGAPLDESDGRLGAVSALDVHGARGPADRLGAGAAAERGGDRRKDTGGGAECDGGRNRGHHEKGRVQDRPAA
ncbi:MAG: extracellular solute-binding protein [Betaproteobacteria bacterium]|nr:extracellular solute-binding protein [Betaproteobacteria bacterium]